MISLQEAKDAIYGEHDLPPHVQRALPDLPQFSTRVDGAALIHRFYGVPVAPRTLEKWPLAFFKINGWAVTPTVHLLSVANAKLNSAIAAA